MSMSTSTPPLSQFSNSSSESSSDFVLLSRTSCEENSQRSCSGRDESTRIKGDRSSAPKPGSPEPHDQLIARVQNLTKENEELRGVLLQNNTLLQEYFHDLAGMQKNQKQTNEALRKGYDRARDVVKKLRDRSASLKSELKNSQEKVAFLEEQLKLQERESRDLAGPMKSTYLVEGEDCSQLESLHKVIQRLESDRSMLQVNNSKLQEHITVLQALREAEPDIDLDEKCETLKYVDSLVTLSSGMQLSLTDTLPPGELGLEEMKDRLNKTITEKEILKVDFERLQIEKDQALQQCLNLQDEHDKLLSRMAQVQEENKELGKTVGDVKGNQASEDGKKQAAFDNQADVAGQVAELSHQVELERERFTELRNERDLLIQEKEMYKQKAEECEVKNESFTQLKCELEILTLEKETYLRKIQELEIEKERCDELKRQLDVATKEREKYMKKIQELELEKEKCDELKRQLDVARKERETSIKKIQELEVEKEKCDELKRQLDVARKERETSIKKMQELEVEKGKSGKLKQQLDVATQLIECQNKGKEAAAATDQSTQLPEEMAEVKHQLHVEKEKVREMQEELNILAQERDIYKTKTEEFEARLEEAKNSAEAFGLEEDPVMKEKLNQMTQIKKQLWHYQNREGDLLDRENTLLEKEEACKKILQDKEKIELQLQEVLKRDELLVQEAQEREQEVESLKKQLSSMSTQLNDTHEQKTSLLREELQKAGSELAAVQSREEHLRAQVLQLIRENQSLEVEIERTINEASQKDDMYQRHLQKVAEETEEQKKQREEVIATLKTRLTSMDGELQKSYNLQEVYRRDREDILAQHEQLVAEYDDLLKSFQSTLNANKHREDNANEEYRTRLDRLQCELSRADDAIRKKKEDCSLLEDELKNTKEDVFELQKQTENIPILKAQLEVYQADFQVERDAREKQHEEILRLREQLQHYQEAEMEVINNTQMAEMQRRHGSYPAGLAEPSSGQNTGGGLRGVLPGLFFIRGANEPAGDPGNMEGMPPDTAQIPAEQEEPQAAEGEEDWICPTCRNIFPNFDMLQMHAVECNEAAQGNTSRPAYQAVRFECPKCLTIFPDFDTLNIHVAECLDAE